MGKSDVLELNGEIVEVLPAGKFKVKLQIQDTELFVMCYKSWKMKQARISLIMGDKVKVEINTYDPSQWRITYRCSPSTAKVDFASDTKIA